MDQHQTTQEYKAVNRFRVQLSNLTDDERYDILMELMTNDVIKMTAVEAISGKNTRVQRNGAMVDWLLLHTPTVYSPLLSALKKVRPDLGQELESLLIPNVVPQQIDLRRLLLDVNSDNKCPINEWKLGIKLGSGGFGEVFLAVAQIHGKTTEIAAKYAKLDLPRGVTHDDEQKVKEDLEPCIKEVGLMMKFDHERIIKCYGCAILAQNFVVFTEYMTQGSVRKLFVDRRAPLTDVMVKNFLIQTSEGLVYLHKNTDLSDEDQNSMAVVHGDIKCDNLLLDTHGNVKLADFGLSKIVQLRQSVTFSSFRDHEAMGGTLFFAAPEVLQGKRPTRKSDNWSLACTAVEMLTMKPPYSAEFGATKRLRNEFVKKVSNHELVFTGETLIPDDHRQFQKMLDFLFVYDPKSRPSSNEILSYLHENLSSIS